MLNGRRLEGDCFKLKDPQRQELMFQPEQEQDNGDTTTNGDKDDALYPITGGEHNTLSMVVMKEQHHICYYCTSYDLSELLFHSLVPFMLQLYIVYHISFKLHLRYRNLQYRNCSKDLAIMVEMK